MRIFQSDEPDQKHFRINKGCGYDLFLAAILAFVTVLMTRVQFAGTLSSATVDDNYFTKFGISAVVLFFILFIVFNLIIPFLDSKLCGLLKKICSYTVEKENSSKMIRFWSILLPVAWLPYYLSYYPGGISTDTLTSISFSLSGTLNNRHPVFYNMLLGLAIKFGNLFNRDLEWSMGLFLAVQMILLEVEIIYLLRWMLIHHINPKVCTCIMIFMTFFPLIPLYAVSIIKDTIFAMSFMLWFMFAVDLYLNIRRNEWNIKTLFGYIAGMFLVAFTRNNGIYIILFTVFFLVLITGALKFIKKPVIWGGIIVSALVICFIQGPVYRHLDVIQTNLVENLGIPLQQICSVVANNGEITEAQKESIDHFIPYENISEHFRPCIVDNIKWYAGMDEGYLDGHKREFFNLWKQLLIQNPRIYMQEYLLQTLGFWDVDVSGFAGYVETGIDGNIYGLSQIDLFEKLFGFSFQHFANPRYYAISGAWFFWIFLIGMLFVMKHYKWQDCLLFIPQIAVWLTLMIATPIAISLRYVISLLFTLPFVIIVFILLENKEKDKVITDVGDKME